MILKEYQKTALQAVRTFLDLLVQRKQKDEAVRKAVPDAGIDWVGEAWEMARTGRRHRRRKNGLGEQLPTFCLKIPTGGGKTLLATKVIDLVNTHYRRQQAGLVLWIVPTTQIYNQTLKALKDRDHPYRQQLDVSSAGKTLILEKNTGFKPQDVRERLCVLLLMLPSANRETKESLRMFRDSGGYDSFFPREDDATAQEKLLAEVPNLNTFESASGVWGRQAKTSLGNTLRLLQPLIILDEGHKAYSQGAKETLEGFNPSMIVELSATPPKEANVLVEITGQALNAEEMIKLDLNIHNKTSTDWHDTLLAAIEHRKSLEAKAREHEAETGAYIRPICLVQVERTGREQRQAGFIHAEDVREYLLRHPEISAEQVAVKTSQRDELKEVDEAGGLLSRDCPIRFIITKQALQEGWDCSFAYVLAILTNPGSKSALTQLVGRILRQPYACKTHVQELDESHVYCFQRNANDLLRDVRKGFGLEGLQGLEGRVKADAEERPGGPSRLRTTRAVSPSGGEPSAADVHDPRRPPLAAGALRSGHPLPHPVGRSRREPAVQLGLAGPRQQGRHAARWAGFRAAVRGCGRGWGTGERGVRRHRHLLRRQPPAGTPCPTPGAAPKPPSASSTPCSRSTPARKCKPTRCSSSKNSASAWKPSATVCPSAYSPNSSTPARCASSSSPTTSTSTARPQRIESPATERQANREDGGQYQLGLFERVSEGELNGLENKVATYLDTQARLFFWYRNRARKDYYVQGWKPQRIYADFILTLQPDEPNQDDEFHQVFVVETKGMHLKEAADTAYKRSVFDICSEHAKKADWAEFVPAMQGKVVRYEVVDEEEWEQRLNGMFA